MKTSPSSSSSLSSSSSSPTPPLSSPCSPVKKRSKGDEAHSMYPKNVEVASYNEKTRRKGREEEGEEERDGLLSSSSSILSPSIPRGRLPSKSHKHQASPTMSGVCTPQGEGGQYMTKYYHSKSSSSSSTSSSPSKIPRLSSSSPLRHSTNLDKSDKALEREGHEEDQEKKFSSSFSSTSPSSPCKKGMNTPFSRVKHHSPSPSIKPSKDKEDNLPSSSSPLSSDVHTPSSTTTRSRYEEGTEQDLQHVRKKSESFPNARASPAVTEWKKKNNNSQKQQESTSERGGAEESRERGLSHLLEKKDHLSMKKKSHGTSRIIPSSSTLLHSQNGKKDPPQEMKEEKKGGKTQEKSFVLSHEEEEEENKKKKKQREDSRHLQHLQSKHNPSFSRPTPHPNAPSSSLAGTPQHVDAGKKRTPSMTSSALSSFSSSSSLSKVHSFQRKDSQMKKLEERPSLQAIPKVTLSILSDLIASSPSLLLQKNKNKNRFPHPASHEQPSSAPSNRPPNRSSPHTPQHKTSSSSSLQQLKKSQEPREDDSPKEEEEEEEERKKEGEECKENQRPSSTTKKQSKNEERNLPLHSSSSPSSSSSPPPQDLSTVAALDLHGRKAEEIDDLSLCKQLRRLDISENLLSSLQFTSMNLELRCLKAANNRLSSGIDLKQSLQHLSNLVVLDLSDNTQIVGLDDFSTLTSLKTLVLSGNGLKKLSFSSPIFSHLECLILSRNKIEEVEKPSKPLQSLKKLSLSDNRLKVS
ncbi:leucine rich repeat-containing protein [Cystoisospora suis]|uniref:Leucine rich repeat-containing protein n=1 Tax=Cystoisospora suis TaxID=483139 RepID=A0A2C6L443_9APIC|nr:leucine rich repeat-containing protein [Cystoisospora suis]